MHTPISDESADEFRRLMAGLASGDPAASTELYHRFGPTVRAMIRRRLHPQLRSRYDSLDLTHDVWATFLRLPTGRYRFDSPEALVGFLTRVAYFKVVHVFRRRFQTQRNDIAREVPIGSDESDGCEKLLSSSPTPSQFAVASEQWEKLLQRFPPGHQIVLWLLRDGHTQENVAKSANVSLSTVERIVRRAREFCGM